MTERGAARSLSPVTPRPGPQGCAAPAPYYDRSGVEGHAASLGGSLPQWCIRPNAPSRYQARPSVANYKQRQARIYLGRAQEGAMTWIARYIPLHLIADYHAQGWTITIFKTPPHSHYAALAVLEIEE